MDQYVPFVETNAMYCNPNRVEACDGMRLIPGWRFTSDEQGRQAIEIRARVSTPWEQTDATSLITEIMYDDKNFESMWVRPNQDSGSYTAMNSSLSAARGFTPSRNSNNNRSNDNQA